MQAQQSIDSQVTHTADHVKVKESCNHTHSSHRHFSHDERAVFYTGHERVSLPASMVQRVRELQETNDTLQRQIVRTEKELAKSQDPLSLVAEIEHCKIIISRNTGEVLNLYVQNEQRLKRLAELELQNINLQQEKSDAQGRFISCHDVTQRAKFASEYFVSKAQYEKNEAEIYELNNL